MNAYDSFPKNFLAADPVLEKVVLAISPPHIETSNDVFHDLMSCVLEQQIHYRSTKKIFQKMLDAANLERLTPDNFLQLEEKSLKNVKLAISKFETINNILTFWKENNIDWNLLDDREIITKLSSIKGIGKWTIDMILLYTLQRPNVFPADDFHLKEIMVKLYGLNPNVRLKAQMMDIANDWGTHKSLAVRYLLAWKTFIRS